MHSDVLCCSPTAAEAESRETAANTATLPALPLPLQQEPLYYQAGALVKRLLEWDSSAETLPGKYEDLTIDLYERGYLELQDVQLTQQWLLALQRIGYDFPALLPRGRMLRGGAPPVPTQRKVAICVSGQLRTFEATIGNITKHVFDVVGDYDVFVYVQTRGTAHEPRAGDTKVSALRRTSVLKQREVGETVHRLSLQMVHARYVHKRAELRLSVFSISNKSLMCSSLPLRRHVQFSKARSIRTRRCSATSNRSDPSRSTTSSPQHFRRPTGTAAITNI